MQLTPYREGWMIVLRSCLCVDAPFRDRYHAGHLS
jgi:hypothetical protein